MARVTLHPAINSLSGQVGGLHFRCARTGNLLVLPPAISPVPSPAQLARRLAWHRLEEILPQLRSEYVNTLTQLALQVDEPKRNHWFSKHLSAETTDGHSPLIPASNFMPPVENMVATTLGFTGWIGVTHTPLPAVPAHFINWVFRRVPAPGEPASEILQVQPTPTHPADTGAFVVTGLGHNNLYSISVHFQHGLSYYAGPSVTQLEVMSGP